MTSRNPKPQAENARNDFLETWSQQASCRQPKCRVVQINSPLSNFVSSRYVDLLASVYRAYGLGESTPVLNKLEIRKDCKAMVCK